MQGNKNARALRFASCVYLFFVDSTCKLMPITSSSSYASECLHDLQMYTTHANLYDCKLLEAISETETHINQQLLTQKNFRICQPNSDCVCVRHFVWAAKYLQVAHKIFCLKSAGPTVWFAMSMFTVHERFKLICNVFSLSFLAFTQNRRLKKKQNRFGWACGQCPLIWFRQSHAHAAKSTAPIIGHMVKWVISRHRTRAL